MLVTECRQIDFHRHIFIRGDDLKKCEDFTSYIFSLNEEKQDPNHINIYENNNGYWRAPKTKKPRSLDSVIFEKEFTDSVIEDIKDFIDS